jgi:plastocyanin
MRVFRLASAAIVAAIVITGCGGGGGGNGGPQPGAQVASVGVTTSATSTTLCGNVSLSAQPRDAQGNNLVRDVNWAAGNTSVIALSSGTGTSVSATGIGAGTSTVTATSQTIPSTPITLTVTAPGQAPATAQVSATGATSFAPTCVTVAAGGTVTWTFGPTTHNVSFGANKPPGGDINERTNTTDQRTFPTAGHFPYDCTLHPGMSGRVIVR